MRSLMAPDAALKVAEFIFANIPINSFKRLYSGMDNPETLRGIGLPLTLTSTLTVVVTSSNTIPFTTTSRALVIAATRSLIS